MTEPIRVLHLEDSRADAKLVAATLADDGLECDITLVDTEPPFTEALRGGGFDLILSDHNLPGFDGIEALHLARTFCPDTPFISVSGAFGEETAAEIVRAGATDYVLKHRLFRLGRAVRRALAETDERKRRARAEAEAEHLADQLRHAQRLEAIGRLAGGVAHDFNNLLTVVNGYCERLLRKLPADDDLMPLVMPIYTAGQRGSELTRRLLAFSRHQVLAPRVVSLNDIVSELRPMLKALVGERVAIVLDLDATTGLAYVDPAQMEQVIMNLATNARDAMSEGGTLTIESRNVHVAAPQGALSPGDYVELAVRDTGHGVAENLLGHIFEPFFTTKERGHGTGLGLPTAYGIVTQSGGELCVESVPDGGTTMRVRLPLASGTPVSPVAQAPEADLPPGGSEHLLLVEDDASVRELVADFLTSAGYDVAQAGDATEAEAACNAPGRRFDLLVSDVVLPGLDGPALAERLRKRIPGLRALLISGYPGDAVVRPSAESRTTFLAKPFSRAVLLGKVREALSA
jgi:two-component system cell cycle sensor histidine kinase/response regulator CckA